MDTEERILEMTTGRTYSYPAYLECRDGSFISLERLVQRLLDIPT